MSVGYAKLHEDDTKVGFTSTATNHVETYISVASEGYQKFLAEMKEDRRLNAIDRIKEQPFFC